MKRFSVGLLVGVLVGIVLTSATVGFATARIRLIVNNTEIVADVPPTIIRGRVMVPARFVAEPLGASVTWDAKNNAVIVTSDQANVTAQPKQERLTEKRIGEDILLNTIRIRVNGSVEQQTISPKWATPVTAKGGAKFVVVNLDTTNITRDNLDVFWSVSLDQWLWLVDQMGRRFTVNASASIPADNSLFARRLAPGITENGILVFEVPVDATGYRLVIAENVAVVLR